ncbi:hypothetical protein GCM10010472_49180 [Pseudonocardia halophobica]|uniref:Uncharacterized protein n=1 Tax=Pseudonocardia halophobica TaxID=29401 RepID=A0A9W6NZZ2_9PSEU|nr:hypothetical protein GCM10017577_64690 [Pseudonocardia halophobica]
MRARPGVVGAGVAGGVGNGGAFLVLTGPDRPATSLGRGSYPPVVFRVVQGPMTGVLFRFPEQVCHGSRTRE